MKVYELIRALQVCGSDLEVVDRQGNVIEEVNVRSMVRSDYASFEEFCYEEWAHTRAECQEPEYHCPSHIDLSPLPPSGVEEVIALEPS